MGLLDIRLGCRLIRCSPFLGHPGNCNILENVYAITYIFVLQLSVLLLCNKHRFVPLWSNGYKTIDYCIRETDRLQSGERNSSDSRRK